MRETKYPNSMFRSFKKNVNKNLLFAAVTSAYGSGFQHGYSLGVLANVENIIKAWIKSCSHSDCPDDAEISFIWAWVVSMYCIGGLVGALLVGTVASKLGRKTSILASNIFVALGTTFMGITKDSGSYITLIIGRFFIGVVSGMAAGLIPMYLTEIAPSEIRGSMGTLYTLVLNLSVSTSQILGLRSLLGTKDRWPILLAASTIPSFCQISTFVFCPESPAHLLNHGDIIATENALRWLRHKQDVSKELREMWDQKHQESASAEVTFYDLVSTQDNRKKLTTAIMLMIMRQASGFTAVLMYASRIFESAGLGDDSQYATIGLGFFLILLNMLVIAIMDKVARRTLLLVGMVGMTLSMGSLMISLIILTGGKTHLDNPDIKVNMAHATISVSFVIIFVGFFNLAPGPIPFFIINELFSPSARPIAVSVGVAANWITNFIVAWTFSPIQHHIGPYVFVIFVTTNLLFTIYIAKWMPDK